MSHVGITDINGQGYDIWCENWEVIYGDVPRIVLYKNNQIIGMFFLDKVIAIIES